ncbi:MAG TPA: hypothetical protein VLC51_00550 [Nitrospira sp.]|nr:hypothetical protein [Nitrospira sp.]
MVKKLLSILSVTAISLLCVSLSGCGGSGSEASGSEASLSKKEFVKKAKAICLKSESEQFKAAFAYIESHPGTEEEDAVVPAALPPIEKELKKLREMGAPEEMQSRLDSFYKALEQGIADTKKDPGSALVVKGNPFNRANKLAEAAGLENCSSNP